MITFICQKKYLSIILMLIIIIIIIIISIIISIIINLSLITITILNEMMMVMVIRYLVYIKKTSQETKLDNLTLMFYNNLLSFLPVLMVTLYYEYEGVSSFTNYSNIGFLVCFFFFLLLPFFIFFLFFFPSSSSSSHYLLFLLIFIFIYSFLFLSFNQSNNK